MGIGIVILGLVLLWALWRLRRGTRPTFRALPDRRLQPVAGDMSFEHVLVVGAGQMGGGIAQVVASSGRRVSLHDSLPGAVEHGLEVMQRSLAKLPRRVGRTRTTCSRG